MTDFDPPALPDFTQAEFESWAAAHPPFGADDEPMRQWIIRLRRPGSAKPANDYPRRRAVAAWLADDADEAKATWLKGS